MKYIKQSLLLLTIATAGGSFLHAGKLHDLVKGDDVEENDIKVKKVEQFLNDNKGVDVNEEDNIMGTPLILACFLGNIKIAKILILHGADVNKSDKHNDTPLLKACYSAVIFLPDKYLEIVKLLLLNGADVNKSGFDGYTPLQMVCFYRHIEFIKLLLSYGADINKPGHADETPFKMIKDWSPEQQNQLLKAFFIKKQATEETETNQDVNTRLFIEFNAADHANSFTQNKTLVPFIITDKQRKDLLSAEGFKEVKNKEFIISIGEDLLNNLFFRFEKNKNNTLPVFVFEQPKTIHPYVKQLKIQRDTQVFKNHNIKSYDDLIYKIKLLAFAQKSWQKWNKKQKSKVQFEDVTLNFKSDNSDSWVNFNQIAQ